jgi:hypothetical protein
LFIAPSPSAAGGFGGRGRGLSIPAQPLDRSDRPGRITIRPLTLNVKTQTVQFLGLDRLVPLSVMLQGA